MRKRFLAGVLLLSVGVVVSIAAILPEHREADEAAPPQPERKALERSPADGPQDRSSQRPRRASPPSVVEPPSAEPEESLAESGSNIEAVDTAQTRFMRDFESERTDPGWASETARLLQDDFATSGIAGDVFESPPDIECREARCVVTGKLFADVHEEDLLHIPYAANCGRTYMYNDDARTVSILLNCTGWRKKGSMPLVL